MGRLTSLRRSAIAAGAVEDDVVRVHAVAELPRHPREGPLEGRVEEGLNLAAVVADEVVVVLPVRLRRLETRDAVADVDALDEMELREQIEHPIDTRDPDAPAPAADAVEDLLGRAAAALPFEVLHDRVARAAALVPGPAQAVECVRSPAHRSAARGAGLAALRRCGDICLDRDTSARCQRTSARCRCTSRMIAILKTVLGSTGVEARIALTLGGSVVAAFALSACGGQAKGSGGTKVVAAFYPLAYAAEQLGGDGVRVRDLTPAGAEPHDLELRASAVREVLDADLVVYLGRGFQPGLERVLDERSGPSLDLLQGQRLRDGSRGDAAGKAADLHVWLDPARYGEMAKRIAVELGNLPADAFVQRLRALDGEYRRGLATCQRREIVTSHAAFGYLADRYRLRQIPLTGVSPESEPSAQSIAALVREVRSNGATTVFFETLVSPKLAETVAREAGVKTAVLNPLEGLTGDEIAGGADYFSVMRENLAALREALGCR